MTPAFPNPGQLGRAAASAATDRPAADPADPGADLTVDVVATAGASPADDPRVSDALSRLSELDALPLAEQVEVFADIHRRLAAVLADPDSRA